MANEARYRLAYTLANGTLTQALDLSVQDDQASQLVTAGVQDVGFAAHEALNLGDVSTPGVSILYNLDSTNFVQVGIDSAGSFVPVAKIRPGMFYVAEPAATLYVKADTAAVKLQRLIPST